jgi:hypothetical protein
MLLVKLSSLEAASVENQPEIEYRFAKTYTTHNTHIFNKGPCSTHRERRN